MNFQIPCGKSFVDIKIPGDALVPMARVPEPVPVDDAFLALECALEAPIASAPLAEMACGRKSAVVVISDITRPVPNQVILPGVLTALERAGISTESTTILIATGLHRGATEGEVIALVGESIARKYRVVSHDARKTETLAYLGESLIGAPIWLNKAYVEADLKIVTGLIEPHFMAGFSGGRKGVCPGVAGAETVCGFHAVELMDHPASYTANLQHNPVHLMADEIADIAGIDFLVNVTIDRERRITGVFAGDWRTAWATGVGKAQRDLTRLYEYPAELVITSAGGWPLDATFYQTVKGMYAGAQLARLGGDVLTIAGCEEGMGSEEYADLMRHAVTCEDFANKIRMPGYFTIDQWQVQKHCQAANRARLLLHTPGLNDEPLADYLVEPVSDPQAVVDSYLRNTLVPAIAVLAEGPYVIPVVG